ncbi:MAG: trypsin-like serine protease [Polyangiaceae bacterium]|nr:trypsin-like serine protease [Polyangiaceae bacterium]
MAASAQASDLPELAARTAPSVVHLDVSSPRGEGSGTGFFVSADGRILTNFHVVDGGTKVSAKTDDGRVIAIEGVLAWDADKDLAVLQAEAGTYPALSLGDSGTVRPGDEIFVIGSPHGLSNTLSSGIVSAIREQGISGRGKVNGREMTTDAWGIQITAPISPGSSGSPIVASNGKVIAIAVGARDGQSLNFGIPSAAATNLLNGVEKDAKPKPLTALSTESSSGLWKNLAISAGVFGGVALVWLVVSRLGRGSKTPRSKRAAS